MPNLMILFILPFIASALMFALSSTPGKSLKRLAICLNLIPLFYLILHHQKWIGSGVQYAWRRSFPLNSF